MMSILLFGMIWMRYIWALAKYREVHFLHCFLNPTRNPTEEHVIPLMSSNESGFESNDIKEEIGQNNNGGVEDMGNDKTALFVGLSVFFLILEFLLLFGRIFLGMFFVEEIDFSI